MRDITILALEGTMASTVTGPLDIFSQAGVLWNRINGMEPEPAFRAVVATLDGGPVRCTNGVTIQAHTSIRGVRRTDVVIVSAEDLARLEQTYPVAGPWLLEQFDRGATIASVCTGAFLMAETGLLNGKRATTHWGFAELFRKRYPKVDLRVECLITDEGNLLCAGGAFSYFDLSLYLVERYLGFDAAAQCARALLLDLGRPSQIPYAIFEYQKQHQDPEIVKAQDLIERNSSKKINLSEVAGSVGMSPRNFKRRFKAATGDTPLSYLQRYRMETAKRLLQHSRHSVAEICYQVGYEDPRFFSQLFKRNVNVTPHEYRRKMQTGALG